MTSPDTPPPHAGPELSRRTVLKTGAGATAAAVVGTGAIDDLDPVGEADALGFVAGAAVGAVVVGGIVYADSKINGDTSVDTSGVLEDEIYNTATSVEDGRSTFVEEMTTQFIDRPTNQTPYANAAWQEARVAATREIVNGNSQSDAEAAAAQAIDVQTTKSIVNIVERWNTALEAIAESLVIDHEESVGVYTFKDGSSSRSIAPVTDSNLPGNWAGVSASEVSGGGFLLAEATQFDLPSDPTNIDGRDNPLKAFGIVSKDGSVDIVTPDLGRYSTSTSYDSNSGAGIPRDVPIQAQHSSLSNKVIFDSGLYSNILTEIGTAYDNIQADLSTYVGELYNGITEGAIDPSNILSSTDIVQEFANSSAQSRLAAEIMAIGGSVPGAVGYQAEISHPDLASEKLWGWLYPQFGTNSPVNITPGTTLEASDYDMAYFGYDSAVDDSFETRVLSGDKKLTVHQVDGIEGQDNAATSDSNDSSTGTNGGLTIWDPDATEKTLPEMLETPSDYDGWGVRIDTPDGTTVVPISDISEASDGSYKLDSTPIPEGTTVDGVDIVPGADYEQPVTNVADPTTIDTQETIALLEEQRKTIEELKEALDTSGGIPTGGLFDGGIPTLPGLGVAGTAGAVILGLFGLNAATS